MVKYIEYSPDSPQPAVKKSVGRSVRIKVPQFLKSKKFWLSTVTLLVASLIAAYFFIVRPGLEVQQAYLNVKAAAEPLPKHFENQDVISADRDLKVLEGKLAILREKIDHFGFTDPLPFLGQYFRDARHILLAAQYGTEAGEKLAESLLPYAADISFESGKSATTEQKIQAILPIMPKIAPSTDQISSRMKLVSEELNSVNPDRYLDQFQGLKLKEMLRGAKDLVNSIDAFMPEAKEVLLTLPTALGSPSPKTYFVLFQNDKELRPTGGFLTAYTYMTISKGKMTTGGSENITKIDDSMRRSFPAPTAILRYLPLVYNLKPRDSNLSPDFVESMNKFDALASYSSAYARHNGFIAVDTYLLQDLLRLTGPVKVIGDTFSAENVVEKLEIYAEQVFINSGNRKAFLGDLMKEVLHRLLTAGKDKWRPIIDMAIKNGVEKHYLLYSRDSNVQMLVEKYDLAGRIKNYDFDYLHINDTNFAGAKANIYIKQKIIHDINIGADGSVTKKVTVEISNPGKYDGFLNGPYRDWVRMYVPKGSEFVKYEGGQVKTSTTSDELGKTMFESFLIARPHGTSSSNKDTWSVNYKLPFKVPGGEYKLLQQKQPGVDGPQVVIIINGKTKVDEQLRSDKEFTIPL